MPDYFMKYSVSITKIEVMKSGIMPFYLGHGQRFWRTETGTFAISGAKIIHFQLRFLRPDRISRLPFYLK